MHNFRNINKLNENKYIFVFGLNHEEIEKSEKLLVDNMSNPSFISSGQESISPAIERALEIGLFLNRTDPCFE